MQHRKYYQDLCLMAIPLLCMAWFYYGLRPVLMCAAAFVLGNLCDRVVARLRRRPYIEQDYSSESFALLIALLLPPACSWYVLVVAVPAVLVGSVAAWYVNRLWMDAYQVQISLTGAIYLLVALGVLAVIVGCVLMKSWRIANENPVLSIKIE